MFRNRVSLVNSQCSRISRKTYRRNPVSLVIDSIGRVGKILPTLLLLIVESSFSAEAIALQPSVCPDNVETLVDQMLPDLPGYANRVLRRSPIWNQSEVKIYVITAGNPEFEPLPLSPGRSNPRGSNSEANTLPSLNGEDALQQLFITTLERQYRGTQVIEIPRYHWLFLTNTAEGWRLALIFSRTGSTRPNEPLTPPEESSQSFMAEAIRLWLRDLSLTDCRDRD
jgi:hypothetical protein